jgi:hypothetical protein
VSGEHVDVLLEERLALGYIDRWMPHGGWKRGAGFEQCLQRWEKITDEVNSYAWDIVEYLNELHFRDRLAVILQEGAQPGETVPATLLEQVHEVDVRFIATTEPDVGRLLDGFAKQEEPGFWWRRLPSSGPLAAYLWKAAEQERAVQRRWQAFALGRVGEDG